jgi:hypothetical protein
MLQATYELNFKLMKKRKTTQKKGEKKANERQHEMRLGTHLLLLRLFESRSRPCGNAALGMWLQEVSDRPSR